MKNRLRSVYYSRPRSTSIKYKVERDTGAPKLINSEFLEKRARSTVFIFSKNKSLLISFGAPVNVTSSRIDPNLIYLVYSRPRV